MTTEPWLVLWYHETGVWSLLSKDQQGWAPTCLEDGPRGPREASWPFSLPDAQYLLDRGAELSSSSNNPICPHPECSHPNRYHGSPHLPFSVPLTKQTPLRDPSPLNLEAATRAPAARALSHMNSSPQGALRSPPREIPMISSSI